MLRSMLVTRVKEEQRRATSLNEKAAQRVICAHVLLTNSVGRVSRWMIVPASKARYVGLLRVRPETAQGIAPIGDYPAHLLR